MNDGVAVVSAAPYANQFTHSLQRDNHVSTSSLYRLDVLFDAQPTSSEN